MASLQPRSLYLLNHHRHPFEDDEWLRRPVLYGSLPDPLASDDTEPQVPRLIRNQGIRLGASMAGQALSYSGSAVTLSGLSAASKAPRQPVKYESVRKSQLRAKGLKPQRGVSYLPESDARVNRWHERRLSARTKNPIPRGTIRIRMGSTMMVAGRLVPYLAIGYLAYELLPDRSDVEQGDHVGKIGSGVKANVDLYVGFAGDAYTTAQVGYVAGKALLGVFS